jgi:hypothetical protein
MSKISRFVVLVTALTSLVAVMSSTAGAVTWHNTGNTAYTATGGAGTLSTGGGLVSLSCPHVRVTGTSPAVTTTNNLATLTTTFTNCSGPFGVAAHVHCTIGLTGIAQDVARITGTGDVHCVATIGGIPCTITGAVPGSYTNPASPTPGTLHIPHNGAGLTVSGSGCPLSGAATLSAQTWRVTGGTGGTGALGPIFTRTA